MNTTTTATLILVAAILFAPNALRAQDILRDGQEVELSGVVQGAGADDFILVGDKGRFLVEVDDFDEFPEGSALHDGDEVIVRGVVDADLFHDLRIEAAEVLVPHRYFTVYASSADEEDVVHHSPKDEREISTVGTVVAIRGTTLTLDDNGRSYCVDTRRLGYNPFDNRGFLRVDVGTYIKVKGKVRFDLQERHEVEARSIVELTRLPETKTTLQASNMR